MSMLTLMYVAIGGAVGSMGRYLIMSLVTRVNSGPFPYGTLAVNVLGAFLMGIWIAVMASMMPSRARDLHLLFAVGVLGGFTTFSAFTVDVFLLIDRGLMFQAIVYVLGSMGLCLLALMLGMWFLKFFSA